MFSRNDAVANVAVLAAAGLVAWTGNAWPDLAGCLLTFNNPLKRIPHHGLDSLNPLQTGQIGDLTASRKVRVMEIPI